MNYPIFAFGLPHGSEWLWIALIVILLFGAEKLPKLARGLGKSLGEFKKAKDEFEKEIRSAATTPDPKLEEGKPVVPPPGAGVNPTDDLTKKS